MKQTLLKAITIFFFLGSITIFIIYRSGKIDNIIQSSPNGGAIKNTVSSDSLHTIDTAVINTFMYSSKSMILIPSFKQSKDTSQIAKDTIPDSTKTRILMGGSKSIRVIETPPTNTKQ